METAKFVGVETFIEGVASSGTFVSAEWGELKIEDADKNGRAVYAIRPEHIRIQKEKCENALAGVVKNCIYRGAQIEMQIVLGERVLRAHLPAKNEILPAGEPVQVILPKEHLFIVR